MTNTILNNIISALLIPAIPVVVAYIVAFLRKKVSEIETKTQNDILKKYMDILETLIETAVTAVSQTYVDALKNNNTFDKAAQAAAFEAAKQKVLSGLSEPLKLVLSEAYGDLEAFIDARIEFYVHQNKS